MLFVGVCVYMFPILLVGGLPTYHSFLLIGLAYVFVRAWAAFSSAQSHYLSQQSVIRILKNSFEIRIVQKYFERQD